MKNISKIAIAVLVLTLVFCSFMLVASAETEEERKPVFVVIDADGKETNYYSPYELHSASMNMKDGSTMRLLEDIYLTDVNRVSGVVFLPKGGIEQPDGSIKQRELYFDFAGHMVAYTADANWLFGLNSSNVKLNVYSSKPGATYFGVLTTTSLKGGGFATIGGENCELNVGDFGEYSGNNISSYSGCFINISDETSTINVNGGNYYRYTTNFIGFMIVRAGGGTINLNNANFMGTTGIVEFNFCGSGALAQINANNCIFANLQGLTSADVLTGAIIRRLYSDSIVNFNGCAFSDVDYYIKEAPEAETKGYGTVRFDINCVYNDMPNSFANYMKYPIGKDIVNANRNITGAKYPIITLETQSFDLIPYEREIRGKYALAEEEDIFDISWEYLGKQLPTEQWLRGEVPVPPFDIPEDTEYVKYKVDEILPVTDHAYYSVSVQRNFKMFYNYDLHSALDLNVFIPKCDVISKVTLGGKTYTKDALSKLAYVTVGGVEYYKLSVEGIAFSNCTDNVKLDVTMIGNDESQTPFTESKMLNLAKYSEALLNDADKASVHGTLKTMLEHIETVYKNNKKTLPEAYRKLLASVREEE